MTSQNSKPSSRLNTKQACNYCGLGYSTLNKLRLYGGGPKYIKIGARVIYDTADLDAWLAAHQRRNTSQHAA